MTWLAIIATAGPFALSLIAVAIVRAWAIRTGFVDRPGGHKGHERPIALGGGIGIYWAVMLPVGVGLLLAWWLHTRGMPAPIAAVLTWVAGEADVDALLGGVVMKLPTALAILGGMTVMHVVGLIDDRRALGPAVKFILQLLVAGVLVIGFDLRIATFLGPVVSSIVTIGWLVTIMNAMNFLDNMDGLSAGVALIAAGVLAATGMRGGQVFVPVLACVTAGAAAGFLVYNFPPASVFMGDAGSLVIGYLLGVLTVLTTYYDPGLNQQAYGFFLPIVVLAVPLYDVATVVWHRVKAGANVFRGDHRHFSHRLIRRGLSVRSAVLTIYLATLATALPGMLLPHASWIAAAVIFAQCLCILMIVAILEHIEPNDTPH